MQNLSRVIANTLLTVLFLGGGLKAQQNQLFNVIANPQQLNLNASQQALIQQVATDVGTLDYKIVAFSDLASHMNGTYLSFNVPTYETQVFSAYAKYVEVHPDGGYTWAGQIQTLGKGDFVITVKPGAAPSGFIRFTDRYYSIYGLSEYYAILVKHNLSSYDADGDDTFGEAPPPPPACNDTAFVDILILETPAARAALDLLPSTYLTNAFANINHILIQSGVQNSFVRVQRHTTTFTPTVDCNGKAILDDDFGNNNPFLINLRNIYKADGIILLTTCLDQAGWAVPGLNIQRPYAVVNLAYAMGPRFSLAHEFGHLLSAKHNRVNNGGDEPNDDPSIRHGWRFIDADGMQQWTIMAAYPDPGRILHFSNPDISYNGVATGTPTDNNAFATTVGMCSMGQNEPLMPPLFTVLIQGTTTLCVPNIPNKFKAFVTGPSPGIGMGPFNYEWRWSKNLITPSNPGILVGGNSPELSPPGPFTCDSKYYLQVKVSNPIWGVVRQNIKIIDPGLCTICPDFISTDVADLNTPPISLSIVPNPAKDWVTFNYQISPSESAFLEIIRADGLLLQVADLTPSEHGLGEQSIDLQYFSSGLYAVRIVQASSSLTHLFSIIK